MENFAEQEQNQQPAEVAEEQLEDEPQVTVAVEEKKSDALQEDAPEAAVPAADAAEPNTPEALNDSEAKDQQLKQETLGMVSMAEGAPAQVPGISMSEGLGNIAELLRCLDLYEQRLGKKLAKQHKQPLRTTIDQETAQIIKMMPLLERDSKELEKACLVVADYEANLEYFMKTVNGGGALNKSLDDVSTKIERFTRNMQSMIQKNVRTARLLKKCSGVLAHIATQVSQSSKRITAQSKQFDKYSHAICSDFLKFTEKKIFLQVPNEDDPEKDFL